MRAPDPSAHALGFTATTVRNACSCRRWQTSAEAFWGVVSGHSGPWQAPPVESGERMFLWCDGGPALGRAVLFPPPHEVEVDGGLYVLVDDGPPEEWRYEFVQAGG